MFTPVDIIIVSYNAKNALKRCLTSLEKHTTFDRYQLTIFDNHSTDGTWAWLQKFYSHVQIIRASKNLGFSAAANIALKRTSHPWVVLLDDDVVLTHGWLVGLLKNVKNNKKVGIVGPRLVDADGRLFSAEFKLWPFGMIGKGEKDRSERNYKREADALPGPCWLMNRKLFEKVGDFDVKYFPSQYEDLDYCLRARLAGFKIIYDGRVKVWHKHLFRFGHPKHLAVNAGCFFKKWGKQLRQMTLRHDSVDKFLEKGATLLFRDLRCPVMPDIGRVPRTNEYYPSSLYLGLGLLSEKKNNKAAVEFKKAVHLIRQAKKSKDSVASLSIIASGFHQCGFSKEAGAVNRQCAELLAQTMLT